MMQTNELTDQIIIINLDSDTIQSTNNFSAYFGEHVILTKIFSICLCTKGVISLEASGNIYNIEENDLFLIGSNNTISNWHTSDDFNCKIIEISIEVIKNIFQFNQRMINTILAIKDKPIIKLDNKQSELFIKYTDLMQFTVGIKYSIYQNEIIAGLAKAFLYNFYETVEKSVEIEGTLRYRQGDVIFIKFIALLNESEGKERRVNYYADRLCISHKYLTKICVEKSNKSASKWIADYTISKIRDSLMYSQKSIKEIANELGFDNLSFFGKYVKKHLGQSPSQVRKGAIR